MDRAVGRENPAKQAQVVSGLIKSTDRATRILDDLLDLPRSTFGTEIPVSKTQIDLADLSETIADELRSVHSSRVINVMHEGDPNGLWDAGRLGQRLDQRVLSVRGSPAAPGPQSASSSPGLMGRSRDNGRAAARHAI